MNDQEKKDALFDFVKKAIESNRITSADAIYQRDSLAVAALDFMCEACEIVGFAELGEDDE